jgi:hypothetical protein
MNVRRQRLAEKNPQEDKESWTLTDVVSIQDKDE